MKRSIDITYTLTDNTSFEIPVRYEISKEGNLQRLDCIVDMFTAIPSWLQLRKFQVTSQLIDGVYDALYNEENGSRNIDSMLFIDKAYVEIMRKEKIKIYTADAVQS